MAYEYFNNNPMLRNVGDCSVRAISKALDIDWESAYITLFVNGYAMCDMPSSDSVWGAVLRQNGFYRKAVEDTCPDCYTAEDFLMDNPKGTFVLAFGGHVATAVDGVLYDSWDSSHEIPQFYYYKKGE
jgi:hypothetical protein